MSKTIRTPSAPRLSYYIKRGLYRKQTQAIARHLLEVGNVSRVEAEAMFKTRNLPGNIKDIRDSGVNIRSDFKVDTTGQRYVRYVVE